jgi:hypothetical protein
VILRPQIQEIRASSISLMPEDIEKTLSKRDLADVIAYLRGGVVALPAPSLDEREPPPSQNQA